MGIPVITNALHYFGVNFCVKRIPQNSYLDHRLGLLSNNIKLTDGGILSDADRSISETISH